MAKFFYHRRNAIIHLIDASSFFIGVSLCSFAVIVPSYIKSYTDNKLLISAIPFIVEGGMSITQILSVYLSKRNRNRNSILRYFWFELFHRVSFIAIGISILVFAGNPTVSLISFYVFFIFSNLIWGMSSPNWIDTISLTIPDELRASFIGRRDLISRAVGILASLAVPLILSLDAFPQNYGYLFIISGVLFSSGVFFFLLFQPINYSYRPPLPIKERFITFLNKGLIYIRDHKELRSLLFIFWGLTVSRITFAYLTPYVIDNVIIHYPAELHDRMIGWLNTWLLISTALCALIVGDIIQICKHKKAVLLSIISLIASNLLILVFPNYIMAIVSYFFLAFVLNSVFLVPLNAEMDLTPIEQRSTVYAINNTITAGFILLVSIIGGIVANWFEYRGALIFTTGVSVLLILPTIKLNRE